MSFQRHVVKLLSDASKGLYEVIEETVHDNGRTVRGPQLGVFRSIDDANKFKDELDELTNKGSS